MCISVPSTVLSRLAACASQFVTRHSACHIFLQIYVSDRLYTQAASGTTVLDSNWTYGAHTLMYARADQRAPVQAHVLRITIFFFVTRYAGCLRCSRVRRLREQVRFITISRTIVFLSDVTRLAGECLCHLEFASSASFDALVPSGPRGASASSFVQNHQPRQQLHYFRWFAPISRAFRQFHVLARRALDVSLQDSDPRTSCL
jgi:hypothetical protein